MGSLGKFGVEREAVALEPITFDWFEANADNGDPIRLPALALSDVDLVDLMSMAQVDDSDPMALAVVKDLFRAVIHPEDFQRFWLIAKQHRQQIEDFMPVWWALLEALSGRPTQRLSDSSVGQPSTPTPSPASSSSVEVEPGRPDLVLLRQGGEKTRADLAARMAAAV